MSSQKRLRWASALGTLLLALISGAVVAAEPKPSQAPLHPALKILPSDASIQSNSHVS
jgi:hypothetical protein